MDLLDNEEGFDKIKMERVLAGIRRQILTLLFAEWAKETRESVRTQAKACEKLQSALHRCKAYGAWAGELGNLGFHIWRRMTKHKLLIKRGEEPPLFERPKLVEWDRWVVRYTARLALKAHVRKIGAMVFLKNKFRRWRYQAQFMAAQNLRVAIAVKHHNNVWMSKITKTWGEFCRGRGKAARRRETYLQAWAQWAPRKKKLNNLKREARMVVKQGGLFVCAIAAAYSSRSPHLTCLTILCRGNAHTTPKTHHAHISHIIIIIAIEIRAVRLRCLLKNWNMKIKDALLISGYGNHRIIDPKYKKHRFALMAAAYLFLNRTTSFVAMSCFRKWFRYAKGVQLWKSFKFWHYKESATYLMRTVFKAWFFACPKRYKPVAAKLTLFKPHNFIDRSNEMLQNLSIGYDPSNR